MEFSCPTFAEVSLAALDHNLAEVRARIAPGTGILAMVKADAYGHGAVPIAQRLAARGAAAFGVATVEEGSELRAAGITQPVLVMGGLMGQSDRAAERIVAERLTPVIHTRDTVAPLAAAAKAHGITLPIHLKIDTGMSRLGARPEHFRGLVEAVTQAPSLKLEGVMTHFAFAADADYTALQMAVFQKCVLLTTQDDIVYHVANSAAVIRRLPLAVGHSARHWVRPGIMLYGAVPFPEDRGQCDLQPVMTLKSQIILLKRIPADTSVSYSCTWKSKRAARVATVPIGYADGYPWSLANRAEVLIHGRRFPIIGRVTMDFILVDVTDNPAIHPGDEVVLLGRQGNARVTAEELAEWAGTIPYEIVCRVSKRMPRVYVG